MREGTLNNEVSIYKKLLVGKVCCYISESSDPPGTLLYLPDDLPSMAHNKLDPPHWAVHNTDLKVMVMKARQTELRTQ